MRYNVYPVPAALRGYIRYFWSYDSNRTDLGLLHVKSFADRFPRLVYQDMRNFAPIYTEKFGWLSRCYLSGVDTVNSSACWEGAFSHFGVSFYSHALSVFFRMDAAGITDTNVDILDLDKTTITEKLDNAQSHAERVSILSGYFIEKLSRAKPDTVIQQLLLNGILQPDTDVQFYAHNLHLTERQLQRRFKQHVGISLKKYQRILSFEQVLRELQETEYGSLTDLAYRRGYYDQAHFNRDFKEFSGITPYQFVKERTLGSESSSFIYLAD